MSDETMITAAEARALREARRRHADGYHMAKMPDAAIEDVGALFKALEASEAARERLTGMLAECFRLSGADPDGDEDWRLAESAVQEVATLRRQSDEYADAAEDALKASEERVGEARIMAGLILSAYDPATPADRAAPTAAAAIERAHRFLLDTKPTALRFERTHPTD